VTRLEEYRKVGAGKFQCFLLTRGSSSACADCLPSSVLFHH
jgi:hypothetical protein